LFAWSVTSRNAWLFLLSLCSDIILRRRDSSFNVATALQIPIASFLIVVFACYLLGIKHRIFVFLVWLLDYHTWKELWFHLISSLIDLMLGSRSLGHNMEEILS